MRGPLPRVGARLIRSSLLIDRTFDRFDRLRSRLVSRLASDAVLEAYNDLNYGAQPVYQAGTTAFRAELFNWEAEMLGRVMPPAPGRVLVGGAGGGREAFALADRGYEVTAFEPSPALASSMAQQAAMRALPVQALRGRYEQTPRFVEAGGGGAVDLSDRTPFDGAVFGWTSYSHVRSRAARVRALRAVAALVDGPTCLSFYFDHGSRTTPGRAARVLDRIGLGGGLDRFTPHVGFFHLSRRDELESEIAEAQLIVLDASWDDSDGRWPWVAAARPGVARRSSR